MKLELTPEESRMAQSILRAQNQLKPMTVVAWLLLIVGIAVVAMTAIDFFIELDFLQTYTLGMPGLAYGIFMILVFWALRRRIQEIQFMTSVLMKAGLDSQ